jgi:hypothetical protein
MFMFHGLAFTAMKTSALVSWPVTQRAYRSSWCALFGDIFICCLILNYPSFGSSEFVWA